MRFKDKDIPDEGNQELGQEEVFIFVDVQHPEVGEWYRCFKTMEEAERYLYHITYERGMIAAIRNFTPTYKQLMEEVAYGGRYC